MTLPATSHRLINKKDRHNKFYEIEIVQKPGHNKYTVVARWGAIGTSGRKSIKGQFVYERSARNLMDRIIKNKLSKGYQHDTTNTSKKLSNKLPDLRTNLSRFSELE